jgi:hypothetical protein
MNFEQFWNEQAEWSRATFGQDHERGPAGPLKHLQKEVGEVFAELSEPVEHPLDEEEKQSRLTVELADLVFLVFDATRRSGGTFEDADGMADLCATAAGELSALQEDVAGLLDVAGNPDFKDAVLGTGRYLMANVAMACWKLGISHAQLLAACFEKLALNKTRSWPKPTSNDEPVEHDRSQGD